MSIIPDGRPLVAVEANEVLATKQGHDVCDGE